MLPPGSHDTPEPRMGRPHPEQRLRWVTIAIKFTMSARYTIVETTCSMFCSLLMAPEHGGFCYRKGEMSVSSAILMKKKRRRCELLHETEPMQ